MIALINTIRQYYQKWREKRFLKKHGCDNWEQYNYLYDTDIIRKATALKDFYHGYPHVYCFEDRKHDIYFWDLGYDGTFVVNKWCKENLTKKFRIDFHRVIKQTGIGSDGSTESEWFINEIGGGDYVFFACEDSEDFLLFRLKFS